jgi:hypothetical protein
VKLFGYSSAIEITLIRDNLLSLNLDDGSSLQGEGSPIGSQYHRCAKHAARGAPNYEPKKFFPDRSFILRATYPYLR